MIFTTQPDGVIAKEYRVEFSEQVLETSRSKERWIELSKEVLDACPADVVRVFSAAYYGRVTARLS